MLKLRLGDDREPHCSRSGCDKHIGTIRVVAWEMAHDEFPASSWSKTPEWTDRDDGMTKYGGCHRYFVMDGRWRVNDGVWRQPKRRRSRRPQVTSFGDVSTSDDFGKPHFDPFHAPALPAIVECPRCKARQIAEREELQVASPSEDSLVDSGREPAPLGKVHPTTTKRMDDYISDMAAEYHANRDESDFDDEPLEKDPQR
jgi:hypothetical protein